MPMEPPTATHQKKKVRVVKGKPIFYEPPEVADAREKLLSHLLKHVPTRKLAGPVELIVKWCFPRGRHKDGEWRTTKPDTDNLNKLHDEAGLLDGRRAGSQRSVSKILGRGPGDFHPCKRADPRRLLELLLV